MTFADAGVPTITYIMPAAAIAFVPVVVIEARILGKKLFLDGRLAVRTSIVANLVSSAIGVPLTWMALAALQLLTGGGAAKGIATIGERVLAVTWQAPWLIRYGSQLHWMIPAAVLVLLVPFFLVSWRVESAVARIMLRESPRRDVSRAVLLANAVTYAALALIAATILIARLT